MNINLELIERFHEKWDLDKEGKCSGLECF